MTSSIKQINHEYDCEDELFFLIKGDGEYRCLVEDGTQIHRETDKYDKCEIVPIHRHKITYLLFGEPDEQVKYDFFDATTDQPLYIKEMNDLPILHRKETK